jgi:hypothetical protein
MRQHTGLPAMMGVVRNHERQHGWPTGHGLAHPSHRKVSTSPPGRAKASRSISQHRAALSARAARACSCVERARSSEAGSFKINYMRGREPQPFAADVMDMRENCGDRTRPVPGWFGAPRARIEIPEDNLVRPAFDCVSCATAVCGRAIGCSRTTKPIIEHLASSTKPSAGEALRRQFGIPVQGFCPLTPCFL